MSAARFSIVLAALLIPVVAQAGARPSARGGYSLELVDEWGTALPTFHHRGATYVLGHYGNRYDVRVRNHTGQRIEAVVTVDGRDVISGVVGDYSRRGYIIQPYGTVTIDGFRQSHSAVAAFRFTSPGDSYSARMGTPQHVGVVGVAIFAERARPVARPYRHRHDDLLGDAAGAAPPAPRRGGAGAAAEASPRAKASQAPSRNNIGTQYGETRHSPVVEVAFERARPNHPDQVLAMYYDDAAGLRARGISVDPPAWYSGPSPFPREQRFAPPPP